MAKAFSRGSRIVLPFVSALFLFAGRPLNGQNAHAKSNGQRKAITLRLLDGKTGWRIRFLGDNPNIWIVEAKSPNNLWSDWKGEVHLDVPESGLRVIRVVPDWYADCRYSGDKQDGDKVEYSIDEILNRGVVANNVCGHTRAKPVAGVLVLYVRSRTWKEIMAL